MIVQCLNNTKNDKNAVVTIANDATVFLSLFFVKYSMKRAAHQFVAIVTKLSDFTKQAIVEKQREGQTAKWPKACSCSSRVTLKSLTAHAACKIIAVT
jgi:hypothetical protein